MTEAYDRVRYQGHLLNYRTLEMFRVVERNVYFPLAITQGSYNPGVEQSGGTHDGGGVLDIGATRLDAAQRLATVIELRRIGFAAWLRTPSQGDWPYHIHAVAIGDRELSPAAARQVVAYRDGRNGLANNGPDDGPTIRYAVYPQRLRELWMTKEELQNAVLSTPIDNRQTPEPGDEVTLGLAIATLRKQMFDHVSKAPVPVPVALTPDDRAAIVTDLLTAIRDGLEFQAVPKD